MGQIILIAVAVAVTIWAAPAAPSVWQGALAGLAGSAASQTVGVVTGIQEKFDFKGLALSAISGGVGAGVGQAASALGGTGFGAMAARGVLGSALAQGIGVATGLQSKFDFAGVAAAGVGAGIGSAIGGTRFAGALGSTGGHILANTAGGVAASAAQSLVTGRNFGDTLIANLPGIIANTIGSLFERAVANAGKPENLIPDAFFDPPTSQAAAIAPQERILLASLRSDSEPNYQSNALPGYNTVPHPETLSEAVAGRSSVYAYLETKGGLDNANDADLEALRRWDREIDRLRSREAAQAAAAAETGSQSESGGFFGSILSWFSDWEWPTVTLNRGFSDQPSLDAGIRVRMAGGASMEAAQAQRLGTSNFIAQGFGNFSLGLWEHNVGFTSAAVAPPLILMTERSSSPYVVSGGRSGFMNSPLWPMAIEAAAVSKIGPTLAAGNAAPSGKFYTVAFETKLKPASYPGVSRGRHFQEANEAYLQIVEGDAALAVIMKDMGINIQRTPKGLAPRTSPDNWTWHHAPEPGIMQLVPRTQHKPGSIFQDAFHPDGKGGYSIWGK